MPENETKRKILFVDDEVNVLQGLKRMLRPMRQEWDVSFSSGGEEALQILSEAEYDVVVSDMQMPGMNGAQLLGEVMQRHPKIIRIVLSGHSSKEATVKSVGVAHRFLAKPCDAEELRRTLNQTFALHGLLTNEALIATLSQLKSVPSLPSLYEELMEELRLPDASIQRVGQIIEQDPGMSTKILHLVNSAFFGLARQVSSPAQAATLLGAETIKSLVLGIALFSQFEIDACSDISPEAVQEHSTLTAAMAKQIASAAKANRAVVDASLTAGFLHDVGKLVLAQNMTEEYCEVMAAMSGGETALPEVEHRVLGTTHAEVGAYLLGLWGLPESIVEATAFHHNPSESCGESFSPLTAVHIANVFAWKVTQAEPREQFDQEYLTRVGVADRVAEWQPAFEPTPESAGATNE
jgi:putative nucleotidyltransferase with HDIG domain